MTIFSFICLVVIHLSLAHSIASVGAKSSEPNVYDYVKYSVDRFLSWYDFGHGVFIGHMSNPPDWCRGNSVSALSNYLLYYGPSVNNGSSPMSQIEEDRIWTILTEVQDNQGDDFYQTADYFDDILWWCQAYTRAYAVAVARGEQSRADRFLSTAISIHDVVFRDSWSDQPCNGGVFWSRAFSYKNAITNELYLSSATSLFELTNNQTFLDRATATLDWLQSSGMLRNDNLIVDGLSNDTCAPGGGVYTYNQGVLLGGLADLYALSGNATLLGTGEKIATAVSSSMTDCPW